MGPLQVLWRILGPTVHRGIAVIDVCWFVWVTLGLWLTWIVDTPGITIVYLVVEQARDIVVTEMPACSVDSVDILGSRVLPVPLMSVGSVGPVGSVVAVVSVGSVVSNCLNRV